MSYLPPILQILLALIVLIAAVYDIRFRRIPNWLTLLGVVLGFGLNLFLFEASGLRLAAFGLGLAFLIYFPLYLLRGMGAGDVKLMGAIGSIVGPWNWFGIFILTNIFGGLAAVTLLLFKGRLLKTFANVGYMLKEMLFLRAPYMKKEELDVKNPKALTLPHGVMIAVGSIAYLVAAAIWAPR
jgi:prepilin peptidase CpaA